MTFRTLRAELEREVACGRREIASLAREPLSAERVAALPEPLRRYLDVSGAARLPRPRHLHARFRGRIRADRESAWMPFVAEQHTFFHDAPRGPTRLFFMRATRGGVPVHVLHVHRDGAASMRGRLLGLVPVVHADGPTMTEAETVTLLNDACLLAPGAMVDASIVWRAVDAHRVAASYTNAGHVVSAELVLGDDGTVVDFVSDDRSRAIGSRMVKQRWSTPMRDPRDFGPLRVASRGEARWTDADGAFAYIELDIEQLDVEPRSTDG